MLLGLDLASRLTGWCAGDGSSIPDCGAWDMPRARNDDGSYSYGRLLCGLEDYLDIAKRRFGVTAVAYEAPILRTARRMRADGVLPDPDQQWGDNLNKLRLLYPLGAFLEWWCDRNGVECAEVTVQAIKSEVTGNHIAPKDDLVAVARHAGLRLPAGDGIDDAADAFGAWLLLLRATDRKLSAQWDAKICGAKGSLL